MPEHVISKQRPVFRRLLDDLSASGRITLVIGAGASLDSGLPSWSGLLRTLLENGFKAAANRDEIDKDGPSYEELAALVTESKGLTEAATIARYLHGAQRDVAIRTALYEEHLDPPSAGRIYRAIVSLCSLLGEGVRIVTTNFDDILECAILERTDFRPRAMIVDGSGSLVPSAKYPEGEIEIVHLHGLIPFHGEAEGAVILDERDFAVEAVRPPGMVLPEVLDGNGPTLFLGLSLTDPNIVAACHLLHTSETRPWYGLFVGSGEEDAVVQAYSARRLKSLKITPLPLASFGQISQVVYELIHRIRLGETYWQDQGANRYGLRLLKWRERITSSRPGLFGGDDFSREHADLHDSLVAFLEELKATEPIADRDAGEHFGIHLWARQPNDADLGWLELLGASAQRFGEHWPLKAQRLPVVRGSGISAVESVFFGSVQKKNTAESSKRWKAVLAVPVDLVDDPDNYIIGGVITLSSTMNMVNSPLRTHASDLAGQLHSFGAKALS